MVVHVTIEEFEARALELIRKVGTSGQPIVITEGETPTVEIRPVSVTPLGAPVSLAGAIVWHDESVEPIGEDDWLALK